MLDKPSTTFQAHTYHCFELGGVKLKARLFGKPRNGSLSQLASPDPAIRDTFAEFLGWVHHDAQIGKAYAPTPTKFTDRIIAPDRLTVQVPIGKRVLYRNSAEPADGVPIKSGEACFISPSSCPTTVMVGGDGTTLVLHTGRDCLVDRHALKYNEPAPGRWHTSIIFSALHYLGNPEEVYVKVLWSVPPHLFAHDMGDKVYGEINKKRHNIITALWGPDSVPTRNHKYQLDLPKLIRDQCASRGVPESNIDLTHAYQSLDGTWLDGKPGTPRNLVVVSRHS